MFKEFFSNNLGLKLFSLLLAVLFEFHFYSPDNSRTATVSSVLEIRNVPQDQMVTSSFFGKGDWLVRLTVRGPAPSVDQVVSSPPKIIVQAPGEESRGFKVVLSKNLVTLPPGVELVGTLPQSVEFRLHRLVHKRLNVEPNIVGDVPPGYRLEGVTATPSSVMVSGPLSELETVVSVQTEEINWAEVNGRKHIQVALKGVSVNSELEENMVDVELRVPPSTEEKVFEKMSVKVLAPSGYAATLEPSNVNVVVGGPIGLIQGLNSDSVELTVDASALSEGTHRLAIDANLPQGLRIVRTEPKEVKVVLVTKK